MFQLRFRRGEVNKWKGPTIGGHPSYRRGQAQGRRRRRRILHRRAQTSSFRRQPLRFQAQMICRGGAVPMKSWLEESMERTPMRERMMREPRLHESRT